MQQGISVSEDEIGIVSEQMCKDFFLPELTSLSEKYGGIGIHCCANSRHQWNNFKSIPKLKLLNLCRPEEVLKEAYEFFADTSAQYHSWAGNGAPCTWISQRPINARFVIEAYAKNKVEALEMCSSLKRVENVTQVSENLSNL